MHKRKFIESIQTRLRNIETTGEGLSKYTILISSLVDLCYTISPTAVYTIPLTLRSMVIWTIMEHDTAIHTHDPHFPPEPLIIQFTNNILQLEQNLVQCQNRLRSWYNYILALVRIRV